MLVTSCLLVVTSPSEFCISAADANNMSSDLSGKSVLTYEGPEKLFANQLFKARLNVKLGVGISPGGRVVIAVRHVSDFGDAQTDDPSSENYITVECSNSEAEWQLKGKNDWKRHPWNRGIDLELISGELKAGDDITIHLGGLGDDCPGYRCQSFAESLFRFRLGVETDGSGNWWVAPEEESPGFRIVGAAPSLLSVVVPDVTRERERAVVFVKPEDIYGNVAGSPAGEVALLLDDSRPLGRVSLEANKATSAVVKMPNDGKWHVVTGVSDDGRFFARSNPVGPSPVDGFHLYWGEIHSQSGLCDGTNSPAELYEYARTAAGLDFASVSSHDFELTTRDWDEIKEATREANRPGEFVTFLGYEWSGGSNRGGDNNIYFLGDDGPLLYNAPYGAYPAWDPTDGELGMDCLRDLSDVVRELGDTDALIVPHCGGRRCNFDFYDEKLMPVFEIHSCHRNYEHVAFESIERGVRFGFIGGSDDHRGALGDSHPAARERFFSAHNGLAAVYARELTRESLWEAFFARRVYATNGPRIVLDFRINDVMMGSELRVRVEEELKIKFWIRLDGMMDRVDLVRGTETIRRFQGIGNQVSEFSGEHTEGAKEGTVPYYIRIFQTDGGMAWASPIWVDGVSGNSE